MQLVQSCITFLSNPSTQPTILHSCSFSSTRLRNRFDFPVQLNQLHRISPHNKILHSSSSSSNAYFVDQLPATRSNKKCSSSNIGNSMPQKNSCNAIITCNLNGPTPLQYECKMVEGGETTPKSNIRQRQM